MTSHARNLWYFSDCSVSLKRVKDAFLSFLLFSPSFTGCECFSGRGTDERWELREARLGFCCSVDPASLADANPGGGTEQPEDVTSSHVSRHCGCGGTRPQPDPRPPGPAGADGVHVQRTSPRLAPLPGGLCCRGPQWDFPLARHSRWSRSSPQNRR